MTNLSKWLDEIETALVRAETAKKDLDLLVVMRAVREILEHEVRKETEWDSQERR